MKLKKILSNFFYMLNIMWEYSKTLVLYKLSQAMLNGILPVLNTYIIKVLLEQIAEKDWQATLWVLGILTCMNLVSGWFDAYSNKKISIVSDLFRNYLMFEFNAKVANMDYEILYTPNMIRNKELALQTIQGNRAIIYLNLLFSCVSSMASVLATLCLLVPFTYWIYFVVIVLAILRTTTVIADKKNKFSTSLKMASINTEISYYMNMLTDETYAHDVKMHSLSNWIIHKYEQCILKTHELLQHMLTRIYIGDLIRNGFKVMETLLMYGCAAFQMVFLNMSFANYTLIVGSLRTLSEAVSNISRDVIDIGENSAYIQYYRDFMEQENIIAVSGKGKKVEDIKMNETTFELKEVSFSYPGTMCNVLNSINLKIERDKFYVIVGRNGSGKTTLVRLLCRMYDVSSGALLYMNTNVKDLEYQSYRNCIGVVFQDYKYYCLSIAENVALNDYNDSPEINARIKEALEMAGLWEKIVSLPKGMYTQLGKIFEEDGLLLSGGEVQKLALARLLFKNPEVVILDEPSSSLDPIAESELIHSFRQGLKGKTVIYISHRMSVTKYADKVIYIENGNIEGFDTHENLLGCCEAYQKMYDAQAKHYR